MCAPYLDRSDAFNLTSVPRNARFVALYLSSEAGPTADEIRPSVGNGWHQPSVVAEASPILRWSPSLVASNSDPALVRQFLEKERPPIRELDHFT